MVKDKQVDGGSLTMAVAMELGKVLEALEKLGFKPVDVAEVRVTHNVRDGYSSGCRVSIPCRISGERGYAKRIVLESDGMLLVLYAPGD